MDKEIKPDILQEQFIPDHTFIYITKGAVRVFDGIKHYQFKAGDSFLIRKNRLVKFKQVDDAGEFEAIVIRFEEALLFKFHEKSAFEEIPAVIEETLMKVKKSEHFKSFISSIKPPDKNLTAQYEELLNRLLKIQPELASVLFNFNKPVKIKLETFLEQNYTFNVELRYFAAASGRSIDALKREFKKIYNSTPVNWLTNRRLEESYYLINEKGLKPTKFIYDLGFLSLSHFSNKFKELYGMKPAEFIRKKRANNQDD